MDIVKEIQICHAAIDLLKTVLPEKEQSIGVFLQRYTNIIHQLHIFAQKHQETITELQIEVNKRDVEWSSEIRKARAQVRDWDNSREKQFRQLKEDTEKITQKQATKIVNLVQEKKQYAAFTDKKILELEKSVAALEKSSKKGSGK